MDAEPAHAAAIREQLARNGFDHVRAVVRAEAVVLESGSADGWVEHVRFRRIDASSWIVDVATHPTPWRPTAHRGPLAEVLRALATEMPWTLAKRDEVSKSFARAVLSVVPWVDAPRVSRCLDAILAFPKMWFVPAAFGDADLSIPPPFFPLFEYQTETQYGLWIADPESLDGALLTHYLDGSHSSFSGRTGVHFALDLLEASRAFDDDERPLLPLAEALFPEAAPSDLQLLMDRVQEGEWCSDAELSKWPVIAQLLSPLDEVDPRDGESAGYGDCAWTFESRKDRARTGTPVERFHVALSSGDVRSAWGALGSTGWSSQEMLTAWAALSPHVHPTLKRLVDAKLLYEAFPSRSGY